MEAHLERHLDGGRTVIGVETTGETFFVPRFGRAHLDQALRERDRRLVGEPGEQDVLKVLRLPAHRGADGGMGMAEEVHPPRADGVEVTAPVLVFQPHAMGTADGDRRQPFMVLHLRAGVPQDRPITLAEVHTPWPRFNWLTRGDPPPPFGAQPWTVATGPARAPITRSSISMRLARTSPRGARSAYSSA